MTGFAQVRGEIQRPDSTFATAPPATSNGRMAFALSLKSVNHRFLDLHFRLPSGTDSLEMQLRRLLKEKMGRGHVEISLSLERSTSETFSLNREIIGGYIAAFRAAAAEFSIAAAPDLNAVLRIPGALDSANETADGIEVRGCGDREFSGCRAEGGDVSADDFAIERERFTGGAFPQISSVAAAPLFQETTELHLERIGSGRKAEMKIEKSMVDGLRESANAMRPFGGGGRCYQGVGSHL